MSKLEKAESMIRDKYNSTREKKDQDSYNKGIATGLHYALEVIKKLQEEETNGKQKSIRKTPGSI